MSRVQIESDGEGWWIEVRNSEGDRVLKSFGWGHNDTELGVGGEKVFADILRYLGHSVEVEDSN